MSHMSMPMEASHAPRPPIAVMALLSFVALAAGYAIATLPWGLLPPPRLPRKTADI